MEDAGGEARVHLGQRLKEGDEVPNAPGAAGGDHRHVHRPAHRVQHGDVKAAPDAVGVDGVQDDAFLCAVLSVL